MKSTGTIVFTLWLGLTMAATASSRDIQTLEKNIPADSVVQKISLAFELEAAELALTCHDGGDLIENTVTYDADRVRVGVDYEVQASLADLSLYSELRQGMRGIDTEDCRWTVSLSRGVAWEVDLVLGVGDADVDLSGLPIQRLTIDLGASDCRMVFDRPNPKEMKSLYIDAGVGHAEFDGLGYANAADLAFDGGTGKFVLNFAGLRAGRHTANIDLGVGSVRIELPAGVPVRVEADENGLGRVNLPRDGFDRIDDGVYETPEFEQAASGLEITLDVGIGKASLDWLAPAGAGDHSEKP